MTKAATALELRRAVYARFPEEARHTDAVLASRHHDAGAWAAWDDARHAHAMLAGRNCDADPWAAWFQTFADATTAAMRRYDEATVRAHLDFSPASFQPRARSCMSASTSATSST
ncbi:MAG: hypothetical protein JWN73_3876 [Betaproteobacteria bacterium]|nr:hypothetical protein [Betaproteobacteria bacterium]